MSTKEHFRNFCMRAPRPAFIRVLANDETQEIEIAEDQNWARLGETLEALDPDRLELYNAEGTIIRAEKRRDPKGASSVSVPEVLHKDPETARMVLFANLIHRAYEHSTNVAFNRLLDIVSILSEQQSKAIERTNQAEQDYRDALDEIVALRAEAAGTAGAEDPSAELLRAFAGGAAKARAEKKGAPPKEGQVVEGDGDEDDGGDDE